MKDPVRWLERGSELDPLERRVLKAGAEVRPPTHAKRAGWSALAAELAVQSVKAATQTGTLAASGLLTVMAKGVAAGLVAGVVVMSGAQSAGLLAPSPRSLATHTVASAREHSELPFASSRQVVPPLPSARAIDDSPARALPAKRALRVAETAEQRQEVSMPPSPAGSTTSSAAFELGNGTDPDPLARSQQEAQAVARARTLLRSGAAVAALSTLRQVESEFPNGLLTQEREALRIEALLAVGDLESARQRARAFVLRYPDSPHAESARRVLSR